MAQRFIQQADQTLAPVYNPAIQQAQAQVGDTQQMYNMLVAQLSQQEAMGTQNVLDSAATRGVSRASLEGQVGDVLGAEAALGEATYGVGQAQDMAEILKVATELRKNRVSDATTIGSTIQGGELARKEAKFNRQTSKSKYKMDATRLKRDAAFRKQAKAYAEANSGGGSGGGGGGYGRSGGSSGGTTPGIDSDMEYQIGGVLDQVRGGDGKVSPKDYRDMLKVWKANGGSENAYHNKFSYAVNLSHPQDYYKSSKKKK